MSSLSTWTTAATTKTTAMRAAKNRDDGAGGDDFADAMMVMIDRAWYRQWPFRVPWCDLQL